MKLWQKLFDLYEDSPKQGLYLNQLWREFKKNKKNQIILCEKMLYRHGFKMVL